MSAPWLQNPSFSMIFPSRNLHLKGICQPCFMTPEGMGLFLGLSENEAPPAKIDGWSSLVGGLNPSEKYARQLGWLLPIYGEKKCSKPPNRSFIPLKLHFMSMPHVSRNPNWQVPACAHIWGVKIRYPKNEMALNPENNPQICDPLGDFSCLAPDKYLVRHFPEVLLVMSPIQLFIWPGIKTLVHFWFSSRNLKSIFIHQFILQNHSVLTPYLPVCW